MKFKDLGYDEIYEVDGGIVVSAICAIASGICYMGAGVASWTGHNKVSAGLTIAGGTCDVAAGIAMLLP